MIRQFMYVFVCGGELWHLIVGAAMTSVRWSIISISIAHSASNAMNTAISRSKTIIQTSWMRMTTSRLPGRSMWMRPGLR